MFEAVWYGICVGVVLFGSGGLRQIATRSARAGVGRHIYVHNRRTDGSNGGSNLHEYHRGKVLIRGAFLPVFWDADTRRGGPYRSVCRARRSLNRGRGQVSRDHVQYQRQHMGLFEDDRRSWSSSG
jgi:hypothetical protein